MKYVSIVDILQGKRYITLLEVNSRVNITIGIL